MLAVNESDKPILYIDEVTMSGRMIVTSLDPFYHHASHFMPATARFLDGFLPHFACCAFRLSMTNLTLEKTFSLVRSLHATMPSIGTDRSARGGGSGHASGGGIVSVLPGILA